MYMCVNWDGAEMKNWRHLVFDTFSLVCTVKMEESVPLEMDNHVLDKEDGCYDNTDATFSDDEEELNNKGKVL